MAVFFAIGGAAVGTVVSATVYDAYSDYSDYSSRYSDYSDYSNYSDAAERRRRRIENLKSEAGKAAQDLEDYKRTTVNPKLDSASLKQENAMTVSEEAMNKDAIQKIDASQKRSIQTNTSDVEKQIREIDELLNKINRIKKGE